jgi:hypothetical protein
MESQLNRRAKWLIGRTRLEGVTKYTSNSFDRRPDLSQMSVMALLGISARTEDSA